MSRITTRIAHSFLALGLATAAHGQFPDNPAANLAVADRTGTQTIPLIGSASDGGTYVAWFDDAFGGFRVYLQRLSAAGVEQWPHNGVLISSHPQNTALFGWDMLVDSADNAVLVFSDIRDGGDLDIHAYKVGPDGAMLWGPNGVTLSNNPDFEPAPRVAEASDGDFVFVWLRDPAVGDADIRMQRLSPDGVPRLAAGGLPVVVSAGEDPGFVGIVASEGGNVILSWLRNIRSFPSPRHIRAQKFSASGAPLWGAHREVFNAFSVPIGYFPVMRPDGAGGAVIVWHRSDGSLFNSFIQRLDTSGNLLFPAGGVAVSTTPAMHHLDPTLAFHPGSGEAIVFWNERNSAQSQWGIYAQKFSASGSRMWGEGGVELMPVNTVFKSPPRSVPHADGAMVFLLDQPASVDRLIGMRVNGMGGQVWAGPQVIVSSASSTKSRYPAAIGPSGVATLAWEDNRGGTIDIYAQNVNPDGSLGIPPLPGTIGASLRVRKSTLTPGNLRISWGASCSAGALDYAIYEGTLGDFASHVMNDCSDDGGDRAEEITPREGSAYYLVVAQRGADEGSYGKASSGAERHAPAPAQRCRPSQNLLACAP